MLPAKLKINPHEYTAVNRTVSLSKLIRSHGVTRKPKDYQELAVMSQTLANQKGEEYAKDFVEIHPDFNIFEDYFIKKFTPEIEKAKTEAKEKYLQAEGDKKTVSFDLKNSRTLDIVIGAGLATASIALIVSLVTAMKK